MHTVAYCDRAISDGTTHSHSHLQVMDDFAKEITGAKRRAIKTTSRTKTKSLGADLIMMFLDKCNPTSS